MPEPYSIWDAQIGMNRWLTKPPLLSVAPTQSLGNPITNPIVPGSIIPGENATLTCVAKKNFQDTTEGKIEGYDRDGKYKWLIGNSTYSIDWGVTTAGILTIVGSITATSGRIANWYINTNTLSSGSVEATSSVLIDSANSLIRVGSTSGNYITIDGANLRIRSSNYVSGVAGAGFTLEPDLLEVGNISARGMIRTSVFQKDVVSAMSGSFVIAPSSDVLSVDMTAADNSTLTIKGTVTFAVNDRLRIKDGTDDEWFLVTNIASAPTYIVTRDQASAYGANANPAWKKGACVTNYGQSGQGLLYLTASDTNNPFLSIFTHAGSPWSTTTEKVRLGNLAGLTNPYDGAALSGYGLWTNNVYLSGVVASSQGYFGSSTNGVIVDSSGLYTIGTGSIRTATSGSRIVLDSSGMDVYWTGVTNPIASVNQTVSSRNCIFGTIIPASLSGTYLTSYSAYDVCSNNVLYIQNPVANTSAISSCSIIDHSISVGNGGSYQSTGNVLTLLYNTNFSPAITPVKTGSLSLQINTFDYGSTTSRTYKIEIDGTGTPNTFKWSDNGGSTWNATGVPVSSGSITLNYRVTVYFTGGTTGGVMGDYWTFTTGKVDPNYSSVLTLQQNSYSNAAPTLNITNYGTGASINIATQSSSVYDILGTTSSWYVRADGKALFGNGVVVIGDPGMPSLSGDVLTVTGIYDITANDVGVGTILFKGTTNRDSAGFIKIYIENTAYYVPVFSAITG